MTGHPSPSVISRYAGGDLDLDEATLWSVEVHLEECADCRARLAGSAPGDVVALLERVSAGVELQVAAGPAPARRRWSARRHRWLVWRLVPWLTMTATVLGCAVLLQALRPSLPSLVLLLAPVAPLPGVAVAWSRGSDPAWELVASTPAAGLSLLLRRAAAVLAVIVPVLGLASNRTGVSLALALSPCLAFTTMAIALGVVVGVRRAAIGLAAAWGLVVALPALLTADLPVLLRPGGIAVWVLVTVASAGFAVTRADRFRRLSSRN
ncbi:zf-HC2 domain-containing protein [Actinoplanes regularis]|uniref:Putative zinc-finger n=1 Tax=Actinoplanes regularis TaxID=52697 RepID=A0A239AVT5_9ACTN|nr:zf-HC2 domain-containing protein [Actinoplanes regularis]GIE87344.1 membrane protein [Actinoplanes regularis]SNR99442.1 Putative zinc-finger [Actinoplanes regularis]